MTVLPLLSPKSLHQFTPKGFRDHVKFSRDYYLAEQAAKKLAKSPPKSPTPGISFYYNKKGTPVLTIRDRKPKWISADEINILAKHHGIPQNVMWTIVNQKEIPVSTAEIQKQVKEIPW